MGKNVPFCYEAKFTTETETRINYIFRYTEQYIRQTTKKKTKTLPVHHLSF